VIHYIKNPSFEIIEYALTANLRLKQFINKSHLTEEQQNYLKLKYDF
jgi:hypothetical protein